MSAICLYLNKFRFF